MSAVMPYPTKNLNADETIALDMHPHWWYFAGPVVATVAAIGLCVYILAADPDGWLAGFLGWGGTALLVIAVIWLISRYTKWLTTNFVVTSHRVIFRQGVVAKRGIEIPLDRVNNVNFHQGMFERMLGAGDLLIESGGEDGQSRFTDIRHPDRVQNLIHQQVESVRQRRVAGFVPPVAAGYDVTEQLERLEGLLERGTITPQEFEQQKQKLLGG